MTLYVTNLPERITPDEWTCLFARFGRVAGAVIWEGANGDTGRRAGVIDMHDGGEVAIKAVEERRYWGRRLTVGVSRPWDPV